MANRIAELMISAVSPHNREKHGTKRVIGNKPFCKLAVGFFWLNNREFA